MVLGVTTVVWVALFVVRLHTHQAFVDDYLYASTSRALYSGGNVLHNLFSTGQTSPLVPALAVPGTWIGGLFGAMTVELPLLLLLVAGAYALARRWIAPRPAERAAGEPDSFWPMEPLDALDLATSTFVDVLAQVGDAQLHVPTPCEAWDVAALVEHVTMGSEMAIALVDGASQEEALAYRDREFGGDDPIQSCRAAVGAQVTRLRAVTDWDATVHHPIGDVPASQLLGFRTGDLTLHAWDLATAIGADAALPADLAAVVYASMQPMEPFIGQIGLFGEGPSGDVADDADVALRLLDLTGRRI
jgi:uncharacterized protein (TIGR03086 family)